MRVYLEAMGCRLNAAEIEGLARQVSGAGHRVVWDPIEAEAIVLNSCAVTAQAVHKTQQRLRALHRVNPTADLAVTGCWATANPDHVGAMQGVRWVVPNADKASTVSRVLALDPATRGMLTEAGLAPWAPGRWGHTRAFLGVQDGCDNACTYCVTRLLRGPGRSLPLREAVAAAGHRADAGAQELVLTGVSLGAYGRDLGLVEGLAHLVAAILAETDIPRLRLSSIEPWDVTPALLDLWRDGRLCRQLHLPLQSGSDAVLRRMGRRITVSDYLALVRAARAIAPEMALTTDLIAGFPGETEGDFAETMSVVEQLSFSRLHVFPYSQRAGTAATRLPDAVPKAVRETRACRLRELGERLSAAYRARFVGTVLPVLWEQRTGSDQARRGLTDNYLAVVSRDAGARFNAITPARMVATTGGVLIGEVVDG